MYRYRYFSQERHEIKIHDRHLDLHHKMVLIDNIDQKARNHSLNNTSNH